VKPPGGRPKAARITSSCFAALIRAYLNSPKFLGYAEATKNTWRRELRLAERPDTLGALSIDELRPSLVQYYIDGLF
jgi:hypothetical protein